MRVLFVGNSYVYFNDLPGLLASLAASTGVELEAGMVVEGGMTLLGHYRSGEATARIREGGWDAVVLQEQSTRPIYGPTVMGAAARLLVREVERAGSRTLLYLTWARADRPEQQRSLDAAYRQVAREVGAGVAPVGPAWQRALSERPDIALHQADGSHPTPAGTYLAACVFLASLTGRSPVGLGARVVQAGDGGESVAVELPAEDASFLQRVAWETVAAAPPAEPAGEPRSEAPREVEPGDDLEVALLQEVSLLRGLSESEIRALLAACPRRVVPAGTTLFSAGGKAGPAYIALDGVFDFVWQSGEAGQIDLARLGIVESLGDEVLRGDPYPATVTTASDLTLIAVGESDLAALAVGHPTVAEKIQRNLRGGEQA